MTPSANFAAAANATAVQPGRRAVLGGAIAGGLILAIRLPVSARAADLAKPPPPALAHPGAFVQIGADGPVRLVMRNTECGQGIHTSSAMILAEELGVGMDQITVVPAPPDDVLYKNLLLGMQATGGSASTRSDWQDMRQVGASARMMLVQAAASRWGAQVADCVAARAVVTHIPTGRTLTYNAVADDAGRLPVPHDPPLKPASAYTIIGTRQKRLDTPPKVNGTARYGIDMVVPGMGIGAVVASPVRGGTLAGFDDAAAHAVPGVRDVVRIADAVAVIADNYWTATKGLAAGHARWNDGPHGGIDTASVVAQLAEAARGDGVVTIATGDAASAIKGAPTRLSATYQLPFLAHAPMEPINTTLHIRPDGADLWVGTQVPARAQQEVMKATGLRADQVAVHNQLMGGAFGRRLDVDSVTQAALIAKQVTYPVKLIWSREQDIQKDLLRPYYYDQVSAGLTTEGRIAGWQHKVTGASVLARWAPGAAPPGHDPDATEGAAETIYDIDQRHISYVEHNTPGIDVAWWRGVGPVHNYFVVEGFVDELAAAAKQDPVAFRRAMLTRNPRARAALDLVARKSGWGGTLPARQGRGVALQLAFNTIMATVLQIEATQDGRLRLIEAHVAVDCGPQINPDTIEAQVQGGLIFGLSMALYNHITHANGRVQQSNFHDYRVLRIDEAPRVAVHIIDNPQAPIGGIGETGTAAAAPVLANAIFAATGQRLRSIPFVPQLAGA